jgi:hypothetical protein
MAITSVAVANAKAYDWQTWLIGIMRSFLSGGAVALATLGGAASVGVTGWKMWAMIGINFVTMGLYRLGEFLVLHGAPDQLSDSIQVAADANVKAGEAIAAAQSQLPEKKG